MSLIEHEHIKERVAKILTLAKGFLTNESDVVKSISNRAYYPLDGSIFLYQEQIRRFFFPKDFSYSNLIVQVKKSCEGSKDRTAYLFFLDRLVFFIIPFEHPKEGDFAKLLCELKEIINLVQMKKTSIDYAVHLFNSLLQTHPEELFSQFINHITIDIVYADLFYRMKIGKSQKALKLFIQYLRPNIKDLCNEPQGDYIVPAIIMAISSFDNPDTLDTTVDFYKEFYSFVRPQSAGKIFSTATGRRLVGLSLAVHIRSIRDRVIKHKDTIAEGLTVPNLTIPTLNLIRNILRYGIEIPEFHLIFARFEDNNTAPFELLEDIRQRVMKIKYKDFSSVVQNKAPRLLIGDPNSPTELVENFCKYAIKNENYSSLVPVLRIDVYGLVIDYICELINAGLPTQTAYKLCVANPLNIVPTINSLATNIPKYYVKSIGREIFHLIVQLFEHLQSIVVLESPDSKSYNQALIDTLHGKFNINSELDDIDFFAVDAVGFLYLFCPVPDLNALSIVLLQSCLTLFEWNRPKDIKRSIIELPIFAFLNQEIANADRTTLISSPEQILEIFSQGVNNTSILDISSLLLLHKNRYNYLCHIGGLASGSIPEFQERIRALIEFLPDNAIEKICLATVSQSEDLERLLSTSIDFSVRNIEEILPHLHPDYRQQMLFKLKDSPCLIEKKLRILSNLVQRMTYNKRQIKQDKLIVVLDSLMSYVDYFKEKFVTISSIPESVYDFVYAIYLILVNTQTIESEKIADLFDFIRITVIKKIKDEIGEDYIDSSSPVAILIAKLITQLFIKMSPKMNPSLISNTLKRLMMIYEIIPVSMTLGEISQFLSSITNNKQQVLCLSLSSIPLTSMQNIFVWSTLSLRFFNEICETISPPSILFYSLLAITSPYIKCCSIYDLLSKTQWGDKPLNIPIDSISNYFASELPLFCHSIIRQALYCLPCITNDSQLIHTVFDIIHPWVQSVHIDTLTQFEYIFGKAFEESYPSRIRRSVILRIISKIKNNYSFIYLSQLSIKHSKYDPETWSAIFESFDDVPLIVSFCVSQILSGNEAEVFASAIRNSFPIIKNLPRGYLAFICDLFIQQYSPPMFYILLLILSNSFPDQKALYESVEHSNESMISFEIPDNFNTITSLLVNNNQDDILDSVAFSSILLVFSRIISTRSLCTKFIKSHGDSIKNKEVAQISKCLALSSLIGNPYSNQIATLLFDFVEYSKDNEGLLRTTLLSCINNSNHEICQSGFTGSCKFNTDKEINNSIASCIPRGIIDVDDVVKCLNGKELDPEFQFWVDMANSLQSSFSPRKDELIQSLFYANKRIIESLSQNIDKLNVELMLPYLFSPTILSFERVSSIAFAIPRDLLHVPDFNISELPPNGLNPLSASQWIEQLSLC